jgi:hypothetical protein
MCFCGQTLSETTKKHISVLVNQSQDVCVFNCKWVWILHLSYGSYPSVLYVNNHFGAEMNDKYEYINIYKTLATAL